jgi:hydroxymethylpyrimidine pyrophosphatase-like HAD family hydrolase
MKKLIIAVDFDGTVCIGNNYPDIGNPRMWLINRLKGLRKDGHKLILWTCRSNSSIPDKE